MELTERCGTGEGAGFSGTPTSQPGTQPAREASGRPLAPRRDRAARARARPPGCPPCAFSPLCTRRTTTTSRTRRHASTASGRARPTRSWPSARIASASARGAGGAAGYIRARLRVARARRSRASARLLVRALSLRAPPAPTAAPSRRCEVGIACLRLSDYSVEIGQFCDDQASAPLPRAVGREARAAHIGRWCPAGRPIAAFRALSPAPAPALSRPRARLAGVLEGALRPQPARASAPLLPARLRGLDAPTRRVRPVPARGRRLHAAQAVERPPRPQGTAALRPPRRARRPRARRRV